MTTRGKFGVFSLASPEGPSPKSPGVDDTGRIVRRRQYHKKSRQGCMKCKARKVKVKSTQPSSILFLVSGLRICSVTKRGPFVESVP